MSQESVRDSLRVMYAHPVASTPLILGLRREVLPAVGVLVVGFLGWLLLMPGLPLSAGPYRGWATVENVGGIGGLFGYAQGA